MKRAEKIIRAYVAVARPLLAYLEPRNTCITQSRITVETLRRLGVSAKPISTSLCLQCDELQLAYISGFPNEQRELLKDAANVIDRYNDGESWRGHVCVLAAGCWWIDSTLDQATMPDRGMELSRDILLAQFEGYRPGKSLIKAEITHEQRLKLVLTYAPNNDYSFLRSEAWRLNPEMDLLCDILQEEVEALLGCREEMSAVEPAVESTAK